MENCDERVGGQGGGRLYKDLLQVGDHILKVTFKITLRRILTHIKRIGSRFSDGGGGIKNLRIVQRH